MMPMPEPLNLSRDDFMKFIDSQKEATKEIVARGAKAISPNLTVMFVNRDTEERGVAEIQVMGVDEEGVAEFDFNDKELRAVAMRCIGHQLYEHGNFPIAACFASELWVLSTDGGVTKEEIEEWSRSGKNPSDHPLAEEAIGVAAIAPYEKMSYAAISFIARDDDGSIMPPCDFGNELPECQSDMLMSLFDGFKEAVMKNG